VNESKGVRLELAHGFYVSPIVRADKDAYLEHFADPEIPRTYWPFYFPLPRRTQDWWLDRCEQSDSPMTKIAPRTPSGYLADAIGIVGELSGDAHSAEFGYWLAQCYRGHRVMPRVIRTFCDYAFQQLRIHRLFATSFSSNLASHRALGRSTFSARDYSGITTESKAHTSTPLFMDAFLNPTTPNQLMRQSADCSDAVCLALAHAGAVQERLARSARSCL
jgi:RimJ/RimL family protein N-acetyltransferase